MTQFNPFVSSALQSGVVQRQQADAKASQIRRTQQLQRNVAAQDEEMETQVESSEELTPTRPQRDSDHRNKQEHEEKDKDADDESHLDLTA